MALLAVEKVDVDCSAVGDVAAGGSVLVRVRGRKMALGLTRRCLGRTVEGTWLIDSTGPTSRCFSQ